ncbi:RNA polymerase subunit sigma-24 [Ahniella affigens]|uniref:RNA polymerase subunit sigma-24 n=1 Tax=Ahniella affigens TaxID=2021234 RepID=A0A2P1PSR2_9GAMM|nr:sigma-70 family RNA polymerase sigma factor [Ahniella affigens]AVP97873.1 RNA polymerase subunit sigma-24 [Ahniella affigens]
MSNSSFAIEIPEITLAAARKGELRAFEAIYRQFERPAYTLALRMLGDPEQAQETVHDGMLAVFKRICQFRGESPFWAWTRQIVVNEALMRLRKRQPMESLDDLAEPGIEHAHFMPLHGRELERALMRLPELTRSVLWLYHVEGYTHEEIAESFGKTVSFSKSQLSRGMERLRAHLVPEPELSYV